MKEELEIFAAQSGFHIACYDEVISTNDTAQDPVYKAGDVVLAERQSRGRGQRGNRWNSQSGENLTFSLVLCPEFLRVEQQFYLSKAVALALCDTLEFYGISATIKWPNDCYVDQRKVAGILIENDLRGDHLSRSIIGIGLNVNQIDFDPSLPNPVSMAQLYGTKMCRSDIFKRLYMQLSVRYGQLQQYAFQILDTDYLARLFRLDEEHTFMDGKTGAKFQGTICGVRPSGELQVKHPDGAVYEYLFKEIEYVLP